MSDEQKERLAWLEHVLSDADCGRLYSREQMASMDEEREFLREVESEDRP